MVGLPRARFGASIRALRRLLSILLLAAFFLPVVSSLRAAAQGEARLPACCRRGGAHHCAMGMHMGAGGEDGDRQPQVRARMEACPCCPATAAGVHVDSLSAPTAQAVFAEMVRHPAGGAQTECKWRMARDRARQKRGPPLAESPRTWFW